MGHLESAGIGTWLFGGQAEELLGLAPPREHYDADQLYPAADFSRGVVIELILVRESRGHYATLSWVAFGSAVHGTTAGRIARTRGNGRLAESPAPGNPGLRLAGLRPQLA